MDSIETGVRKRSMWLKISSFIAAAILVFEFITGFFGVFEKVAGWIVPPPSQLVRLTPISREGNSECLEFAFVHLSSDFVLDVIHLSIVGASGPTPISGDMAARAYEWPVNRELSPDVFSGGVSEIVLRPRIQALRESDMAYVDFCPILSMPGMGGEIRVMPAFFSPAGTPVEDLEVLNSDGAPLDPNLGVAIDVSRPKNVEISLDETRFDLVPR